jgi:hypothetical protein
MPSQSGDTAYPVGMDLEPGWNPDDWTLKQIQLLGFLYAGADGQPGVYVDLGALTDEAEYNEDVLRTLVEAVEAAGYVRPSWGAAMVYTPCALTSGGIQLLHSVLRRRDDVAARCTAARDAILNWMYDQKHRHQDRAPGVERFVSSRYACFLGDFFTVDEVANATIWLRDQEFIDGKAAWGSGILHPRLLPAGEDIAERGGSTRDTAPAQPAQGMTISITNSPGVNVAAQSPGAHQNVTMAHETSEQIKHLADLLDRNVLALDEGQAERAALLAASLRAQVGSPVVERGRMRSHLEDVKALAIQAGGSALGTAVTALAALIHQQF